MDKFVFFDLDGTIVDSTEPILDAFKVAFGLDEIKDHGIEYPGDKQILEHFGKSLKEILDIFSIPIELQEKFKTIFIDDELESTKFVYFEGIEEIIDYLKRHGIPVVIVTSKGYKTGQYVLDLLKLQADVFVTSDDVVHTKPHPEPLQKACEMLGVQPSTNITYVGDSLHDMESAKRAGVTPLGVLWGAHGDALRDHDFDVVKSPSELFGMLQSILSV